LQLLNKVRIKNFKRIQDQTFELTSFDLLVGANNSGKSSVLQALAIWQYCVDIFKRANKKGINGTQIVLPNFTALPVPEFILLWNDKVERKYPETNGEKKQKYILIEIEVFWRDEDFSEQSLNIQLRYQTPQSVYAIPEHGWKDFNAKAKTVNFPHLVYVPPYSGLEPNELWYDDANVRRNVGKAQPGSVLRNLLYRVVDRPDVPVKDNSDWQEIVRLIREWFDVTLLEPFYEKGQSLNIEVNYKSRAKTYDIISAGSGLHQILTLVAFLYGYPGISTILFDEPDAHLHVNLQRKILEYFKKQKKVQFLIATHAEEFIRGVEVSSIISMLSDIPSRIRSSDKIIKALSDIDNLVIIETRRSPYILYVEGEDDQRILSAWASILNKNETLDKFHFFILGGPSKQEMMVRMEAHFAALRQIVPDVKRLAIFDYDDTDSFHPPENNPVLNEWKRKNIENYLLVPEAWHNAILKDFNQIELTFFTEPYIKTVDDFFEEQGLVISRHFTWDNLNMNIFSAVDGKRILFENSDSLFHRLEKFDNRKINREKVAGSMTIDLIHKDIKQIFDILENIVSE